MKNITTAFAAFLILAATACTKDNAESAGTFKVKLTDAPFDATEVNVDIRQVLVNYRSDSTGWVALNTNAGVYNLLALQNNVQTTLATGATNSETVKELRFVLGDANSIKIDSVLYPLTIPGNGHSGLKIKVGRRVATSLDSLVVDFDAGLSILKTGNGEYKLKPVLKLK